MRHRVSVTVLTSGFVLLLVSITFFGMAVVTLDQERDRGLSALGETQSLLRDRLRSELSVAVWNENSQQIKVILESCLIDKEVVLAALRDVDPGVPTVGYRRDSRGQPLLTGEIVSQAGDWMTMDPVVYRGNTLGTLTLVVTPRFRDQTLADLGESLILAIVVTDLVLVLLLSGGLHILVIRPVRLLVDFAGAVRLGVSAQGPTRYGPFYGELDVLREALGAMEAQLQRQFHALKDSEERVVQAIEGSESAYWWWQVPSGDTVFSPRWAQMLGFEHGELRQNVETFRELLHPEDSATVNAQLQSYLEGEIPLYNLEFRMRTKGGSYRWIHSRGKVTRDAEGRATEMAGTHTDVTDRVEAQRIITRSLEEKTLLLQEIHHRIKNNLQIVISLLTIQASANPATEQVFQVTTSRILTMAMIHEALYQSSDLSQIALDDYLMKIGASLEATFVAQRPIRVAYELEPLMIGQDQAVSCGLIANELILNSLKHAFPGGREGVVTVRLSRSQGQITLVVGDNGVGLPPNFDLKQSAGMGIQLVLMLTRKLAGQVTFGPTAPLVATVTFPPQE
ncbi:MAG TPA: histidine kinase dimerization/phosphoacceptor domain -containing protein [Spirochaetia bacterium]|nr:histidine kinase dimerization/phosphoacceptor domain -containing protein [Spirochaetia bacterium]